MVPIVNPMHVQPDRYYLTLPPGRQGIVLALAADRHYYVDAFMDPTDFAGAHVHLGDMLAEVNGIAVAGMAPRTLVRLFREDRPTQTCWVKTGSRHHVRA
jgi:C-terminal processing protease CtpA/Prc